MRIPEFLSKAIMDNKTSLGDHPAFPPEDDDTFVSYIIRSAYKQVMEMVDTDDRKEIGKHLSELVVECQKEEEGCKEALEKLCSDMLATIFKIPEDTIDIEGKIVSECDMSKYRMIPDSTPDFEFEDIDEMKYISDKIYQRRMIDAIMTGMSVSYASNIKLYAEAINKINPRLLDLYEEIDRYNIAMLYNTPDSIKATERANSGCVYVTVGDDDEKIQIQAQGIIFPILLEYSIRGLLDVASLKGLPKEDSEISDYIIGKTDYRLAENWDMRLGLPIWSIMDEMIEKSGYDATEIGLNYIIMELSKLEPDVFNGYMQNTLKKTRKGLAMTEELMSTIDYNKEIDDFDRYVKVQNDKYAINDDVDEYTPEELINEINR